MGITLLVVVQDKETCQGTIGHPAILFDMDHLDGCMSRHHKNHSIPQQARLRLLGD